MTEWLPDGIVVLCTIEIVEYLDAETGEYLTAERFWSSDGDSIPLVKKLGLLEQAKVAACAPMIESMNSRPDDD